MVTNKVLRTPFDISLGEPEFKLPFFLFCFYYHVHDNHPMIIQEKYRNLWKQRKNISYVLSLLPKVPVFFVGSAWFYFSKTGEVVKINI